MIEWNRPASDPVGDFSWPGFDSEVVIRKKALDLLRDFDGWEPTPVEIVGTIRHQEDPELRELWVTEMVDLDQGLSSATLDSTCGTCGSDRWTLHDAERFETTWDPDAGDLLIDRIPRKGPGIVVRAAHAAILRVRQFPAWILCTEPVRDALIVGECTNLDFLEMGETVGAG